jgi:hypothetical protein
MSFHTITETANSAPTLEDQMRLIEHCRRYGIPFEIVGSLHRKLIIKVRPHWRPELLSHEGVPLDDEVYFIDHEGLQYDCNGEEL